MHCYNVQTGLAVDKVAGILQKPLRPLWVSQNSRMWLNEIPAAGELEFVPLLLVSASTPNSRQRQTYSEALHTVIDSLLWVLFAVACEPTHSLENT